MPDLARSTSEMLEEMKKIVQQPEGNTSCAKYIRIYFFLSRHKLRGDVKLGV